MTWIHEEQTAIKREMRRKDKNITESFIMYRYLMLIIPLAIFMACTDPCLHARLEYELKGGWFLPDTWYCKQCGYENFEGITTCPICGTGRQ